MGFYRKMFFRKVTLVVFVLSTVVAGKSIFAERLTKKPFIQSVSRDIAKLKKEYIQLTDFAPDQHTDIKSRQITYSYHTHRAEQGAGWAAAVPNPNPDGIWFYIDVHDPSSTNQIHTQPRSLPICFGTDRISFLILEGTNTKPLYGDIWKILEKNGAKKCAP